MAGLYRVLAVGLLAVLALAATGCGSTERVFTAKEFVAEANRGGARLQLGPDLQTGDPAKELRGLSAGRSEGSLAVHSGAGSARADLERCRAAATLVCYRAANVVLIFDGSEARPGDLARVTRALRGLASG